MISDEIEILCNSKVQKRFVITIPAEGREVIDVKEGDVVGFAEIEVNGKRGLGLFPMSI